MNTKIVKINKTNERESHQEAQPAREKASSVLIKLFISGNERSHTTAAP